MAQAICPECQAAVSDDVAVCQRCGCPREAAPAHSSVRGSQQLPSFQPRRDLNSHISKSFASHAAGVEQLDSFATWRTVVSALTLVVNSLFVPSAGLALAAEISKQRQIADALYTNPAANIQARYFAIGIASIALCASLAQFVAGWGLLLRQPWAIRVATLTCLVTAIVIGISTAEYILLGEMIATMVLPGVFGLIWAVVLMALLRGKWTAAMGRVPPAR